MHVNEVLADTNLFMSHRKTYFIGICILLCRVFAPPPFLCFLLENFKQTNKQYRETVMSPMYLLLTFSHSQLFPELFLELTLLLHQRKGKISP